MVSCGNSKKNPPTLERARQPRLGLGRVLRQVAFHAWCQTARLVQLGFGPWHARVGDDLARVVEDDVGELEGHTHRNIVSGSLNYQGRRAGKGGEGGCKGEKDSVKNSRSSSARHRFRDGRPCPSSPHPTHPQAPPLPSGANTSSPLHTPQPPRALYPPSALGRGR